MNVATPTSLLDKVAIHGFTMPSVVVALVRFARPIDVDRIRRVFVAMRRHVPRLASRVHTALGTPTAFVTRAAAEIPVDEHETLDLAALLRVPDPTHEAPFEVHVAGHELVLRAHHAVLDGAGAMQLARLASAAYDDRPLPPSPRAARARSAWHWLRTANLRARLPADAFSCHAAVDGPFLGGGVDVERFELPLGYAAVRARARVHELTFSEYLCTLLLRTFARMDEARPAHGLLVAAARPSAPGLFRATQLPVEVAAADLDDPRTLATHVRRQVRAERGHDALLLGALYASRRLRPPQRRGPFQARSVHFTYSDLSRWDLARLGPGRAPIASASVLVSPSHPEHAGLTVVRVGDRLHLTLLAYRGVVPLPRLRDHFLSLLELA